MILNLYLPLIILALLTSKLITFFLFKNMPITPRKMIALKINSGLNLSQSSIFTPLLDSTFLSSIEDEGFLEI